MPSNKLHQAKVLLHRPAGRGYQRLVLLAPELAGRDQRQREQGNEQDGGSGPDAHGGLQWVIA